MDVDELTETLHATSVPVPLDLDRVTRDGRRLRTRRRAVLAGGFAAAVAAVAVPAGLWQQPTPVEPGLAATPSAPAPDDSRERAFESGAPLGRPVAGVLQPGGAYAPKFYLGGPRLRSVGAMSLWMESDGLAFGARLVDGDGSLRRAGRLALPLLEGEGQALVRVPFQNAGEPTFVGMLEVPEGTRVRDLELQVSLDSVDAVVKRGLRRDVIPGRILVWVTATSGSEPGLDLGSWAVRDADGDLLARGGFEGVRPGVWEPTGLD